MRQIAVRYFLLNKRLFKKYSFLLILCMVPLLVAGMRLAAGEESGIVRVALCLRNPEDELSSRIVRNFMDNRGILRYVSCDSEEEARTMVAACEVNAAWIFPENMEESLRQAASHGMVEPVVTVVERENKITLVFTREILCSAIFPYFSYLVYEDFVRDDLGMTELSDEELRRTYEETLMEGNLFQMAYLNGEMEDEDNYLLTPLRGMLALWFVLCGLASSMYYVQDQQRGTFAKIPNRNHIWMAFGMSAVLLSDAVAALLIACRLAGVFTTWPREILSALLFAGSTLVFSNLVRLSCRTMERMGSCIPVLLIGMLVLCPVFFNLNQFRVLQYLLPPYYYLKSIHSNFYLYGMAIYTLIGMVLCVAVSTRRS